MKILVTGGAGYIGATVAGLLSEKGHKAVVFDNLSHGRRDLIPAGIEFVEGDVADRVHIENLFIKARDSGAPYESVLHFAALIEAGESMKEPEVFFRNNTAATLSLLEAMLAHGPRRLVFRPPPRSMASRKLFQSKKMQSFCQRMPMANQSFLWNTCSLG